MTRDLQEEKVEILRLLEELRTDIDNLTDELYQKRSTKHELDKRLDKIKVRELEIYRDIFVKEGGLQNE